MTNKKQPPVQLIILAVIMIVIISVVILVYIFRFNLFGPKDLSLYGTRSSAEISACTVEGKTDYDTKCTDKGKQVSITKCIQNPKTGYMCWNGTKQVTNSEVSTLQCIPTCRSFLWSETSSTPCLVKDASTPINSSVEIYGSPTIQWCAPNNNGFKFKTYECNRIDGSGSNLCTFNCDGNKYNPDCYTTGFNAGTTLLYNPAIVPNNSDVDITNTGNNYTYTPRSRATDGFPIIPASTMTIKESCRDLNITTCGNYTRKDEDGNSTTKYNNRPIMKLDCKLNRYLSIATGIGYNYGFLFYNHDSSAANNVYDLFEPGTYREHLTCFDDSGNSLGAKCDPKPNDCVNLNDIFVKPPNKDNNILKIVSSGLNAPTPVCGTGIINSGMLVGVTEDPSILNPCIFSNPNFSVNPNINLIYTLVRPTIPNNVFLFDVGENIFGVPLFIRNANSYLSLYNYPCPNYTVAYNGAAKIINFSGDGTFNNPPIDDIPFSGIPFGFDCKGSISGVLKDTPCTWIQDITNNASSIYGVDSSCDIRNGGISTIMEQTSLMIMVRPANLDLLEIPPSGYIKCNIFAISGSDIVGWLTYNTDVQGYNTTGTASAVLSFSQGRFDPYGNSINLPGNRVENMPNGAFYLNRIGTGTTYTYKLYSAPNMEEIQTINNITGSITNLDTFYFDRATTSSNSLVSNGVINGSNFSNFLYSRSNRGIDGCNALLSR